MGLIRCILRCRRGASTVEAALIIPVLVALLLGMVEITNYLEATRKATSAAQTVADLVAQEATHDDESILDIRAAATLIMQPLTAGNDSMTLAIASVGFDPGENLRVLWQHNTGGMAPTIDPSIAEGLSDAHESVIVVILQFDYRSPFDFLFTSNLLNETAMARPRIARRIALNGSTDHQS